LATYSFEDFCNIIAQLRAENGCPWDREQTHESLRETTLEEAYEVVEAIDKKDLQNLKEELGDILLHIVFHAQIEQENGNFTIADVINGISRKMIYRHPHVFGQTEVENSEQVLKNWEELKKQEKGFQTQTQVLQSVPNALPALTKAKKVQKKAADVGFDFQNLQQVIDKTHEEMEELETAIASPNGNTEEELGDLLFSVVNIARFLHINPEFALTKAIKKFINRFECVESSANAKGKTISQVSFAELDSFWNAAKESPLKK